MRGSEFRGAHGLWGEVMAQFQAQVPDPVTQDLPGFLPTGGVRAPAVGVLFAIFIGEHRLEGATMQVQGHTSAGANAPGGSAVKNSS